MRPPVTHCPKCNQKHIVTPKKISACAPCKILVQQERKARKENRQPKFHKCMICKQPLQHVSICANCKNDDLIEIITMTDESIHVTLYTKSQQKEAEAMLKELGPSPIVVDLHGVLDTVDENFLLPKCTSCCSYVGRYHQTRYDALKVITNRVRAGQIIWGVLVFGRGNTKKQNYETYHEVGSKAWYCKVVGAKMFCDDSIDHVRSVDSFGIAWTVHITKGHTFAYHFNKKAVLDYERERMETWDEKLKRLNKEKWVMLFRLGMVRLINREENMEKREKWIKSYELCMKKINIK